MPQISIITPLYNRYDLVQDTWQSIKHQTFDNWEWIVVDDGSTDEGPAFIEELASTDSRVKLFIRAEGAKGPSTCRNLGVKQCSGNYLLFLDSDDILSQTCLENRFRFMESHRELDFAVFTQASFVDDITHYSIFNKFFNHKDGYLKSFIADQHPWQTSGPLWRKAAFEGTGGFREDYMIMEDPELHIRALLMGLKFEVISSDPDFFYRQSPNTKEQEDRFWENSIKGLVRFYCELDQLLNDDLQWDVFKQSISEGVMIVFKGFILGRIEKFEKEFIILLNFSVRNDLFSSYYIYLLRLYRVIALNKFLSRIPLIKGVVYSFL